MTDDKVPLQVNIDPEIKREFRVYAAQHDMELSDLFVKVWGLFKTTSWTIEEKLAGIALWTTKIDERLEELVEQLETINPKMKQ